jgi:integrase
MLAADVDPGRAKKEAQIAKRISATNTFAAVAAEYIDKMEEEGKAPVTVAKVRWLLTLLAPAIGSRPIAEVQPYELLEILRKIERAGKRETASRMRSFASRVFRYAVVTARSANDPAALLSGALVPPRPKHYAAITDPVALGDLLRAIETYSGQPATIYALKLTPHIFQRPGEIRQMEWREIDFDNAVWSIPATRMKQRKAHVVPLSRQALALLGEMRTLTGNGQYVFPATTSSKRAMSENTINAALRRLGYTRDEMTAHGFRSTASSLLNESGKWNPDAIERALAHSEANQIRAAYHRSNYWAERVEMAQWWSDYLDTLRDGGTVLPFSRAAV